MSTENNSTPKNDEPIPLRSVSEKFTRLNLLDPRSPTTAFQRTPIQVILKNSTSISGARSSNAISPNTTSASSTSFVSLSTPMTIADDSLELSASSASFMSLDNLTDMDSFDLSMRDLSLMVSDFSSSENETENEPASEMNIELDRGIEESSVEVESLSQDRTDPTRGTLTTPGKTKFENKPTLQDNSSECDTATDSSLSHSPLIRKKPLKNVFYTPNPNKKRNPLGPVDNVCPSTPPSHMSYCSPQNALCDKQWKRIQEERKKLGLESDENAQLPLYDITASAPSKLTRKSRIQARFNGGIS